MLHIWPHTFPIVIDEWRPELPLRGSNIFAALEHHDRVSKIDLEITSALLKRLNKVMKKPYPVLTSFRLHFWNPANSAPVLLDTFLGISAPCLRYLHLTGIPFPALPKLLPLCHDLVDLRLENIPNIGYFSPDAMATALSALTKLGSAQIGFESLASRPDPTNRPPPSSTRVVLPALTDLTFAGASVYFEDLVAQIDAPVITHVSTEFFDQLDFSIPHFAQFIGRTQVPTFFEEAMLFFVINGVYIRIGHRDSQERKEFRTALDTSISCRVSDGQVARIAQICGDISLFLSNVQRLSIFSDLNDVMFSHWQNNVDNPQWLELFHAFPALQHIHVPPKLDEIILSALKELAASGGRAMDALPMLHHLYLNPRFAFSLQALPPYTH